MKKNKQGFTLVELLVVVVMLGVLISLGFISMTKYVGDSQDARIAADMKTIDDKLDLSYVNLKKYPMPDNIYSTGMLNGQVVSYAGYVGEKVSRTIGLKAPIINPTNGEMYRYAVNVSRTKTQLATLKKDKVNFLVGGNFDGKIKTSSGETVIPSIVYVNTGSVDLKNDTLVYLGGSSSTPSTPPPVVEDPEFTGNCLADLKPADVDALNSVFVNGVVGTNHQYWFDGDEYKFEHNLSKEEWCGVNGFSSNGVTLANMPRAIGKLYNVYTFDINNAGFTQIPDTIGYLTNLESISITGNPGLVTLPGSIGNLINLKHVNFSGNGLTDLPNNFTKLVHLEYIYLQDNNLGYDAFGDGDAGTKFNTLTKVHEIDLSNNPQLGNNISQKFSSFGEYYYWTQSYAYDGNNFTITRPGGNLPLQFEWNIRVYD